MPPTTFEDSWKVEKELGLHAVPVTGTAVVSTGPERERSVTRRLSFRLFKLIKHASHKAYTAYPTIYGVFSGPVDLSTAVIDGNGRKKCSERAHGTGQISSLCHCCNLWFRLFEKMATLFPLFTYGLWLNFLYGKNIQQGFLTFSWKFPEKRQLDSELQASSSTVDPTGTYELYMASSLWNVGRRQSGP
ncbi:hypothetical protein DFH08DRAFT_824121 [Mycena albidolilacea]|uniref:Uncharacterized protein n=1 Tax=Mycena albidolilacea TaxID=1033008 RepID=A0AAD7EAQ4_9AGAR|nr:hypothetical protein DFH08DRAFT_824121 [Mycena albidolilacea]